MKRIFKTFLALMMCFSCFTYPLATKANESDLAYGKQTTTSSVEAALPNNVGNLVTDNNPDTRWSTAGMKTGQTTSDDQSQNPQWLIIDLGMLEADVTTIKVDFFQKVWATKYRIETSANLNANEWIKVDEVSRSSNNSDTNISDTFNVNQTLQRYVRFYFEKINVTAGGMGVSIRDIHINGNEKTPLPLETTNIALQKPVMVSDIEVSKANLNDGNKTSNWEVSTKNNPYFIIDLKAKENQITTIDLDYADTYWAKEVEIYHSSNNEQWDKVTTYNATNNDDTHKITIDNTLNRYIKVVFKAFNDKDLLKVSECVINGVSKGFIQDDNGLYHYENDFKDGIDGWTTLYGSGASLSHENEALKLTFSNTRAGIVDKSAQKIENGIFEADITPAQDGVRFGFIMRASDENNKVYVGCENSNNKWFWEYWNNGSNTWGTMTTSTAMKANQTYHVKVQLIGNKATLWIDNTQIFSQTMSGNALCQEGWFGFDKSNSAGTFTIDNVEVTQLADSAAGVLNKVVSLPALSTNDDHINLPQVKDGFTLKVVGSDCEGVVTNDGTLTKQNIVAKRVTLLLEVSNNNIQDDTARKNIEIIVPAMKNVGQAVAKANKRPLTIPTIQEWVGGEANFTLKADSKIIYQDKTLESKVNEFITDLKTITKLELTNTIGNDKQVRAQDIYLNLDKNLVMGDEEYTMTISGAGLVINAKTLTGITYGMVTIQQILTLDDTHVNIPCGYVRDYPDYEIRGGMLDVARINHRLQYLEDYVKIFSWFKLSEFHLHLNDDFNYSTSASAATNSWSGMHRLESDVYPSLTNKQLYVGDDFKYYNEEYVNPTYSKDEYRELEAYANSLGVALLPEIDTPSHSTAYIEYAKENPDNLDWLGEINTTIAGNSNRELLALDINSSNATEKEHALNARKFIEALYRDYLNEENPTFTNENIHIGVDEYWNTSQTEQFRSYINFLAGIVGEYGKTARIWGSGKKFAGTTYIDPTNIIIDFWASYEEEPLARMEEGFRIVNYPQTALYTTPGRDHKDLVGEEYLYKNWDVNIFDVGNGLSCLKGEANLIGAKGGIWGDEQYEGTMEADTSERLSRAIAMVAYKTWGGEGFDSYIEYQQTFEKLALGPNVDISYDIESETNVVASYDASQIKDNQLLDLSGNGYDATLNNVEVKDVNGEAMLYFDGTSLMSTPLKTIGYPYTVSFDIKADANNSKDALLFDGYDGQLLLKGKDGKLSLNRSFYHQSFGYEVSTNEVVNIKIVGTWLNTKLYVNNVLVKMLYRNDNGEADQYWTTFVLPLEEIGANFKGYLDNLTIYNKALTPEMIHDDASKASEVNVALNTYAYAERFGGSPALNSGALKRHPSFKAVDGDKVDSTVSMVSSDPNSYWYSSNHNNDYLMVDMDRSCEISKVVVNWNQGMHATAFKVLIGDDINNLKEVKSVTNNSNTVCTITFDTPQKGQYVKIQGVTRASSNYGIREVEVFEKVNKQELNNTYQQVLALNDDDASFALAKAKVCLDSPLSIQSEIDKVNAELMTYLNTKPNVNKAELEKVIKDAEKVDTTNKTVESIAALTSAITSAKEVLADEKVTQDDVDAAIKAINTAVANLKDIEVKPEYKGYDDVDSEAWYAGMVQEATIKGLMGKDGNVGNNFNPDGKITRGMVATVIYRMAGEPKVTYSNKFSDVKDGLWYSNGIVWASEAKVVSGYANGKFGPDDAIKREDFAIMLRNYANTCGLNTKSSQSLETFKDYKAVSAYAKDAIAWCVENGLMSGSKKGEETYLNPSANTTRAEAAKMFVQLSNLITKK